MYNCLFGFEKSNDKLLIWKKWSVYYALHFRWGDNHPYKGDSWSSNDQ